MAKITLRNLKHSYLPFPTQVLLLHDQTEATDGDRTRQREGWPAGKNPPPPRRRAEAEDGHAQTGEGRRDDPQ